MTVSSELVARIRDHVYRRGAFHLPTGQVLDEYFDQYLLAADPRLLRDVAEELARFVPVDTDVLVGVALGGVPLTVAVSAATGIPAAFLRNRPKPYGTFRELEGHSVADSRVVIVDDVIRSGAQSLRAARVLRSVGAEVTAVLCVLDRGLGGVATLAGEGIALRALLAGPSRESAGED